MKQVWHIVTTGVFATTRRAVWATTIVATSRASLTALVRFGTLVTGKGVLEFATTWRHAFVVVAFSSFERATPAIVIGTR